MDGKAPALQQKCKSYCASAVGPMKSKVARDAKANESYSCDAFEDVPAADLFCCLHVCCYVCFAQGHICIAMEQVL